MGELENTVTPLETKEEKDLDATGKTLEKDKEYIEIHSNLPPEEGLRAWLVVLGSFCMHWVALGSIYTVGLFVPFYEEEFGKPRQELIVFGTLQTSLLFAFGIFSGKLADVHGVRKVYGFGCIFYVVGTFLASFAKEFWHVVLTQGVLTGIGLGFIYWPGVTVVPMWFSKRRGLATALAVLGSGVGQFANGLIIQRLLDTRGTSHALLILSFFSAVLLFIGFLLMKRRLPLESNSSYCKGIGILRNKTFVLFYVGTILFQFAYTTPFAHLPVYISDLEVGDSQFQGVAIGLMGAGSALGRVMLGWLSDKIGRLICFKLSIVATSLIVIFWYWCDTEALILTFSILYGFFAGGFIALLFPVLGDYYGVHRLGSIAGLVSVGLVPGAFLGPWIAGRMYDEQGNYDLAIIVCSLFVCASSVVFAMLPRAENVPGA